MNKVDPEKFAAAALSSLTGDMEHKLNKYLEAISIAERHNEKISNKTVESNLDILANTEF